ncbi:GntR family transcriptional regulator [Salipiger aestuarii]|uniref:GntR family transcriptional regulator n=1 Tax=Salipiger aestuarii TaxID=568098 RepID=A0A327Y6C6_9RHOB|nr:GntR family transcriptional regulator [Salipiger aestuarii]EIE50756.1 Transcriptional regulator, GntR family protein [Citreicella sp. 357]KAA8608020.1 GntR family transcriptional regulator [Salipiger aestuarii]KAA8611413.1 GntR family transcriptional regulator [Salipiger aestuarii]KAB2542132.1 GntR family transcriptional regulator [Salipiger aestuarii]RAK16678.1 GntR family transcriptional regulator [Salipiger aestuarii]
MGDDKPEPGKAAAPAVELGPTDRAASMPLWSQVKRALTAQILDRELAPDTRLPSEADLCRSFAVSRTVVREALSQMVSEGLIYRLQGKGAFVRGRRGQQDFVSTSVGFSGELADKHQVVTRRVLRQQLCPAAARARRYLLIEDDEPVVAIDRVLSVDGVARAIVRWAMLARLVPGLEGVPLENRSLYDTISRQYGQRPTSAERWIAAISLPEDDAALLGVAPGTAALQVESVASDPSETPIEYYTALYLTDMARLHVSVRSFSPR